MTACVLSDGRPGHYNQSLGLLSCLPAELRTQDMLALPPPRRFWKNLALLCAILAGRRAALLRAVFRLYYGAPPPVPAAGSRLLVSTGGDTLLANIVLARLHRLPNVYLGKRSRLTDRGVALLFAAEGDDVAGRVVVLDFGPVNVPVAAAPPRKPRAELLTVLVGGDSSEYHYRADDFRALAQSLNALCARRGLRLLLTTSRRTGQANEEVLRAALDPAHLADATWYGSAPRPVTRDYCLRGDAILCSEDSGTMLTEAIHYGRPVFAFRPQDSRPTPFYHRFLARVAAHGVAFGDIAGIAGLDPESAQPATPVDTRPAREALLALLAGQPH